MDKDLFLHVIEHLRGTILSDIEDYKNKPKSSYYSDMLERCEGKISVIDIILEMTRDGKFDK